MENNNRKKYIHIDCETGINEIFARLEEIVSDKESEVDNLLEEFDAEFISEQRLADEDGIDTEENDHYVLIPEATIYNTPVVSDEPFQKEY